jgi:steroid 5-alpha reductase family enzyme
MSTLPAESGIWAISAPLLMFFFLNYFTGIKISEANAEKRRSDFLEYKKKTSPFFPWPFR